MPAILDEAFQSPFNNYKDLNPHGGLKGSDGESSSANIRNPEWRIEDKEKSIKPVSGGSIEPHPSHIDSVHDCDKLISRILTCKRCQEKLRLYIDHGSCTREVQKGGAPASWENLSTTTMGNFAFGIGLILLLDKIVKLKG